jgi:hypothetical protein
MRAFFGGKPALCLAAALVLVGCLPLCQAKLSKYKTGTLLHLAFSNNTECTGTVNTLSDTSFTFNNSDTNAKETHLYSDVSSVEKGKEYIGAGSAPKHHIHIF